MSMPLYKDAPRPSSHSNVGLVFDKFFGGWNGEFLRAPLESDIPKYGEEAKSVWVREIAKKGSTVTGGGAAERHLELANALGGAVWYAVATSRFVTGMGITNPLENGFAFHHTLGIPYLAASGFKGAIRNYWDQWSGDNAGCVDLLGSARQVGSIVLFDMLPVSSVTLVPEVMTPHYSDWYQKGKAPGDWLSPAPIPFIAVEAGALFQIATAPRIFRDPRWAANRDKLKDILDKAFEITGLGAKTAVGYGRFVIGKDKEDAKQISQAIVSALKSEQKPSQASAGDRSGPQHVAAAKYKSGDALHAGTRLTWSNAGEQVTSTKPVVLKPGITIPVAFGAGERDEAPISQIAELRHIK